MNFVCTLFGILYPDIGGPICSRLLDLLEFLYGLVMTNILELVPLIFDKTFLKHVEVFVYW